MEDKITFVLTVAGFVGGVVISAISIWQARRSDRLLVEIHKILKRLASGGNRPDPRVGIEDAAHDGRRGG